MPSFSLQPALAPGCVFRYEFSFAVAAIVAVLLTIGMYCIANYISGREFNATVIAAVLTIIGFSINDKVVIFDRIREDLKLGVRGSFKDIINQALNQTLSRTIITSGTVFLATFSLFWFGGGVINDFAFTGNGAKFLVGQGLSLGPAGPNLMMGGVIPVL